MNSKQDYGKPLLYSVIDELKKYNKFTEDIENIREKRKFLEGLFCGVDIQEGKTSVKVSPFKFEKVPYMTHLLDEMRHGDTLEMKIYKPVSMGATTSIIESSRVRLYDYFKNEKSERLNKFMETLKQKYPDWRNKC